jgi:hypothetical protein
MLTPSGMELLRKSNVQSLLTTVRPSPRARVKQRPLLLAKILAYFALHLAKPSASRSLSGALGLVFNTLEGLYGHELQVWFTNIYKGFSSDTYLFSVGYGAVLFDHLHLASYQCHDANKALPSETDIPDLDTDWKLASCDFLHFASRRHARTLRYEHF